MALFILLGVCAIAIGIVVWRKLYPVPYPGIPYNEESAKRIAGDIPNLVAEIKATNEFSSSVFAVSTQKLGTPIAQVLFPGIRKPLIVLEDPHEIEDIVLRRNKEFDKATTAIDMFAPMFPNGSISQFTTPKLKAQKRLWADVMRVEFLNKAAAPNIHKAALELLELWRLKAVTLNKAFSIHEDFENAALDAIWVAMIGEEPGITRYEIKKLQDQVAGQSQKSSKEPLPRGLFLKEEVAYIADTIARNSNTPSPKWAQRIESYTSRYRSFRSRVTTEIGLAMGKAGERFQRLEMGNLEAEELDTCMMDLVLRRQVLEARKSGKPLTDPTKDQNMLDEMFVMLVGGHDSTANALTWFVRYMEAFPRVQTELREALKAAFKSSLPSVTDILETDIPYLDGTLEESFRLAGVAKGNLRQAIVDTQILGCKIPKGAELFMNYHVDRPPVPVDESRRTPGSRAAIEKHGDGFRGIAGRDIGAFEPRRWLLRDESTGKEAFNPHALPSIAFGGGYRGCAGRKLAYMELRIMVTLLILNLEFLELPAEYKSMSATEKIFRQPDKPYARVRVL
ncbi:cytochrome P450 [Xylariaceae sp. FL0594]|nr:cytochrome P450 [Xylariaceae sp. FL0594]